MRRLTDKEIDNLIFLMTHECGGAEYKHYSLLSVKKGEWFFPESSIRAVLERLE